MTNNTTTTTYNNKKGSEQARCSVKRLDPRTCQGLGHERSHQTLFTDLKSRTRGRGQSCVTSICRVVASSDLSSVMDAVAAPVLTRKAICASAEETAG